MVRKTIPPFGSFFGGGKKKDVMSFCSNRKRLLLIKPESWTQRISRLNLLKIFTKRDRFWYIEDCALIDAILNPEGSTGGGRGIFENKGG